MAKALVLFNIIVVSYVCSVCTAWEVVSSVSSGHSHITASTNYLWSVNGANEIYRCNRPCAGKWAKVDGSLMQVTIICTVNVALALNMKLNRSHTHILGVMLYQLNYQDLGKQGGI